MAVYYVNKNRQPTGEHEVHRADCPHLPTPSNRIKLGECNGCHEAVQKAKQIYSSVDGCHFCSNPCHSR